MISDSGSVMATPISFHVTLPWVWKLHGDKSVIGGALPSLP
jgi:hypothetical protein